MVKKFRKIVEKDGTEYYVEVGGGDRGTNRSLNTIGAIGDLFIGCGLLLMSIPIIVIFLFIFWALIF